MVLCRLCSLSVCLAGIARLVGSTSSLLITPLLLYGPGFRDRRLDNVLDLRRRLRLLFQMAFNRDGPRHRLRCDPWRVLHRGNLAESLSRSWRMSIMTLTRSCLKTLRFGTFLFLHGPLKNDLLLQGTPVPTAEAPVLDRFLYLTL